MAKNQKTKASVSLIGTISIGIGGMVGGGIFAVLALSFIKKFKEIN